MNENVYYVLQESIERVICTANLNEALRKVLTTGCHSFLVYFYLERKHVYSSREIKANSNYYARFQLDYPTVTKEEIDNIISSKVCMVDHYYIERIDTDMVFKLWNAISTKCKSEFLYFTMLDNFIISKILMQYSISIAYCSVKLLRRSMSRIYGITIYHTEIFANNMKHFCVYNQTKRCNFTIKVNTESNKETVILKSLRGSILSKYVLGVLSYTQPSPHKPLQSNWDDGFWENTKDIILTMHREYTMRSDDAPMWQYATLTIAQVNMYNYWNFDVIHNPDLSSNSTLQGAVHNTLVSSLEKSSGIMMFRGEPQSTINWANILYCINQLHSVHSALHMDVRYPNFLSFANTIPTICVQTYVVEDDEEEHQLTCFLIDYDCAEFLPEGQNKLVKYDFSKEGGRRNMLISYYQKCGKTATGKFLSSLTYDTTVEHSLAWVSLHESNAFTSQFPVNVNNNLETVSYYMNPPLLHRNN